MSNSAHIFEHFDYNKSIKITNTTKEGHKVRALNDGFASFLQILIE